LITLLKRVGRVLRRSGLLGLGLGSLDFKNGGMGTGRTAGDLF